MENSLTKLGFSAKNASKIMAQATTAQKNKVLEEIGRGLKTQSEAILLANKKDMKAAEESGLPSAMLDRLSLEGRLEGLAKDIEIIISLNDPIGEIFDEKTLPNGLRIYKERTSLGVLGIIYESRPNVTIDVSCLAIKTGNCALLRGGSETLNTNIALVKIIQEALEKASLPKETIQLIESTDRALVKQLLHLHEYVDLIIPRGGAKLHTFCRENSLIPVVTGGIGICHLFVDENVDEEACVEVIINAKTQRPTVCNALDTVLIHKNIAENFLPKLIAQLIPYQVSIRLDPKAWQVASKIEKSPLLQKAALEDWDTEWLSLVLGIKIVENLEEAIKHIQTHSTGHSDGILTNNVMHSKRFVHAIDSAAVYVNASTRFTDGGQFGLGAEVAISTQKVHARGPMGLSELTSYKWVIWGNYHIRK